MSLAKLTSLLKLTTANPGIWQSNQKAWFSNKPKYTLVTRNVEDHKKRLLAEKYELRRKLYKSVCKDPELPTEMRAKYRCKLSKLPRNSSFTRIRNRCVFTGRPRSVYQLFGMSRIVFRSLANQGEIPGVTKASW